MLKKSNGKLYFFFLIIYIVNAIRSVGQVNTNARGYWPFIIGLTWLEGRYTDISDVGKTSQGRYTDISDIGKTTRGHFQQLPLSPIR